MKTSGMGAYGATVLGGIELTHVFRQAGPLRLHCVEAGPEDGPLVLLLHGFPECWWSWHRQIGRLAGAGLRVVVPDQRGYGTSDKPPGRNACLLDVLASDVASLADALGRPRFSLAGHDWGGIVAWRMAVRYPDRVERLAVLNAPHPDVLGPYLRRSPTQLFRSAYIGFFQVPWLPETVLRARNFAVLEAIMTRTSRPGTITGEDLAIYRQAWAQPGALTVMLNWYRALPRSVRQGLERVRTPALVLWGTRDVALERGLAEESVGLCEDGRLQWFEAAGHFVQHEEPAAVGAALAGFLKP